MICSLVLYRESSIKVYVYHSRLLIWFKCNYLIHCVYFSGDKKAHKNIEMIMRVCDQSGKVIPVRTNEQNNTGLRVFDVLFETSCKISKFSIHFFAECYKPGHW